MNIASIVARHGFGMRIEESGAVTVAFMYNKFEPYKLMPVNIDDLVKKHREDRPIKPIRPQMRPYPEDKAEYLDHLQDNCRSAWEGMEERTRDREQERRDGINEVHRVAEETWKPRFDMQDWLDQVTEMEENLRVRRRALPNWQEHENPHDLAAQARKPKTKGRP